MADRLTIIQVEDRKRILKEALLAYFWASDWHGVADAAMDLREAETELRVRNEKKA